MAFFNFRLFKILVNKKEHSRHFAYSKIHTYIFLFPILGPKLRVFLITGYITQSSLPINYTRDLCPYFLCYLSDRNNYVFRTKSWAAKPAKPAKLARKSRKLKVELSNCFNHNKKDQIHWITFQTVKRQLGHFLTFVFSRLRQTRKRVQDFWLT